LAHFALYPCADLQQSLPRPGERRGGIKRAAGKLFYADYEQEGEQKGELAILAASSPCLVMIPIDYAWFEEAILQVQSYNLSPPNLSESQIIKMAPRDRLELPTKWLQVP
jgi:hypothetical protein